MDCKVDGGIFRGMADQIMTVYVKTREKEINHNFESDGNSLLGKNINIDEQIKILKQKNQQQQM